MAPNKLTAANLATLNNESSSSQKEHTGDRQDMPPPPASVASTRRRKSKCYACDIPDCTDHQRTWETAFAHHGTWEKIAGEILKKDKTLRELFHAAHKKRMSENIMHPNGADVTKGDRFFLRIEQNFVGLPQADVYARLGKTPEDFPAKRLKLTDLPQVKGPAIKGKIFLNPEQPTTKYTLCREVGITKEEHVLYQNMQLYDSQAQKTANNEIKKFQPLLMRRMLGDAQTFDDFVKEVAEDDLGNDSWEESIDDEMEVDDEANPENAKAPGSNSVAGSRRSRAPRKGLASSPRALDEKEAAANMKIEKLNVIGKLEGKNEGVGERWAEKERDELRKVNPRCNHAVAIEDKLNVMTAAGKLTKPKILGCTNRKERLENVKVVKDDGNIFPHENQAALVEREILDYTTNTELLCKTGSIQHVFDHIASYKFSEYAKTQANFDPLNPYACLLELDLAAKVVKQNLLISSAVIPGILVAYEKDQDASIELTLQLEECLTEIDFAEDPQSIAGNEAMLQLLRAVMATVDPTKFEFYQDLIKTNETYLECKSKKCNTEIEVLVVQSILASPTAGAAYKLLLKDADMTLNQKQAFCDLKYELQQDVAFESPGTVNIVERLKALKQNMHGRVWNVLLQAFKTRLTKMISILQHPLPPPTSAKEHELLANFKDWKDIIHKGGNLFVDVATAEAERFLTLRIGEVEKVVETSALEVVFTIDQDMFKYTYIYWLLYIYTCIPSCRFVYLHGLFLYVHIYIY